VEPIAPHAHRSIINALFSRLARLAHSRARRACPPAATATTAIGARRGIAPASSIKEPMYPKARLLTDNIRIISGRHEADCLCRARIQIRGGVHALLDHICRERTLVVYDDVVRRSDRALQARVRLQVKVKVEHGRHALVNDRAGTRVPVPVGVFRVGRVETRVVPLAADDDAQRRVVPRVLGVDPLERLEYLREFFLEHFIVLALLRLSAKQRENKENDILPLIHRHGR